jgi:hypothetical protein
MLFNIVSSEKEITDFAQGQFIQEAVNSASVDQITFQHNDLVRPGTNIVYYPLWVVRYVFQNRTYQVVVDGEDGAICYGKAPGNNLYRAITGIFGTAFGTYLLTFFGIFGIVGSSSSSWKGAAIGYIICVVIGIFLIKWAWKKFRYGGEVEEGTGIVAETTAVTKKSVLSKVSKGAGIGTGVAAFGAGDAVDMVSSLFD